jgi:hypothetical protein
MSCTLATIAACLSFSNLYVDGGVAILDRKDMQIRPVGTVLDITGRTLYDVAIADTARNPYGRFSLGYVMDMDHLVLTLEGSHLSSIAAPRDRGINSLEMRLRWYPFRR